MIYHVSVRLAQSNCCSNNTVVACFALIFAAQSNCSAPLLLPRSLLLPAPPATLYTSNHVTCTCQTTSHAHVKPRHTHMSNHVICTRQTTSHAHVKVPNPEPDASSSYHVGLCWSNILHIECRPVYVYGIYYLAQQHLHLDLPWDYPVSRSRVDAMMHFIVINLICSKHAAR